MKTRLVLMLDLMFVAFITFILYLILLNYFVPHPYQVILSFLLSLFTGALYYLKSSTKNNAESLKKAEQKEMNELISELNFSEKAEQNALIEKALKDAGFVPEKKRGMLFLKEKNALIINKFGFFKVDKADVVRAFNLISKTQKAYILSENFDQEIKEFADRFENRVILIDGSAVYKFMKKYSAIPDYKYSKFFSKPKKASLKNLLDKTKAKNFLLFGLVFLFTSYFTPLKLYYLICGCIFLLLALTLRVFGKEKISNTPLNV